MSNGKVMKIHVIAGLIKNNSSIKLYIGLLSRTIYPW